MPVIFKRLAELRDDPAAMVETAIEHYRREGRPLELFEALKMRIRLRLGLPLIAPEDEPRQSDDIDRQLEAGLLAACRETGELFLSQGKIREGWMYLRPTGDMARAAELLSKIEPNDENSEDLITVMLHEGVDIPRGYQMLLDRNGTCNSITTFEQSIAGRDKPSRMAAARVLLDHFYDELSEVVRGDIARNEAPADPDESLHDMLTKRKWLLADGGYHLDTTHLAAVIRIARVLEDEQSLQKAWELTQYGRRLHHQFQYPGDEPFVDFYPSHSAYFGVLLGRDVDAGLALFERKMRASDPQQHGTAPMEVYTELLDRVGRSAEAIDVALGHVPDDVPSPRLVPPLLEMAARCGHYEPILDYCIRKNDPLGYAAASAAARVFAAANG
ncbi:MAG: hypothetical protein EA381_14130 [Planctomycetaceae bacterium]|nr:MAG: hypothetical protein EA381_14130 [Planctomycetaceae bacterium]